MLRFSSHLPLTSLSPPSHLPLTFLLPSCHHSLPGSLIGLHDPNEGSVLYPYTIIASKTASLLRITASDLHSILAAHGGADEQAGRSLMLSEFEAIQAGMLKGSRQVSDHNLPLPSSTNLPPSPLLPLDDSAPADPPHVTAAFTRDDDPWSVTPRSQRGCSLSKRRQGHLAASAALAS